MTEKPPKIDWQFCLQIANNKSELADKMLAKFILYLDEMLAEISIVEQKHLPTKHLAEKIHKLRGASCYCGAPNIKALTADIELALQTKAPSKSIFTLLAQLKQEIADFKKLYASKQYKK